MVDSLSKKQRSENMRKIKAKNTSPEIAVRSFLFSKGVRYKLHRKDLPGKPDIVVPRIKTIVFVHGCFWHNHSGCKRATIPKSNTDYWESKIKGNVLRDKTHTGELIQLGWKVKIVWECEVKNLFTNTTLINLINDYRMNREETEKNTNQLSNKRN